MTKLEQLERVRLMADGDPTWDLSTNDMTALKSVLRDRDVLLDALERLVRQDAVRRATQGTDINLATAADRALAAIAFVNGRPHVRGVQS